MNYFFPKNPCDLGCLAESAIPPRAGRFRYVFRRSAIIASFIQCWSLGVVAALCSRRAAKRLMRIWARTYTKSTGIRVEISGQLHTARPALVVCNHVTSLDAMALVAVHPFTVVVKEDLATHPILGRLARNAGMIFLRQGSLAALRNLLATTTGNLRCGENVLAFPEGKIRCCPPGGPFSPSLMQAALDAGVPVRPMLLSCELTNGRSTSYACWLGAEPLSRSLRRIQHSRGLVLKARVLPDIEPDAVASRAELARVAWRSIAAAAAHIPNTCEANRQAEVNP